MYVVLTSIFSGARQSRYQRWKTIDDSIEQNRSGISSRDLVKQARGQKTSMNVTKQDSTLAQNCMWIQIKKYG